MIVPSGTSRSSCCASFSTPAVSLTRAKANAALRCKRERFLTTLCLQRPLLFEAVEKCGLGYVAGLFLRTSSSLPTAKTQEEEEFKRAVWSLCQRLRNGDPYTQSVLSCSPQRPPTDASDRIKSHSGGQSDSICCT